MYKTMVILWMVGVSEPTILDDKLGPYDSVEKCFHRGAAIIKTTVSAVSYSIAKAETLCWEMKDAKGQSI